MCCGVKKITQTQGWCIEASTSNFTFSVLVYTFMLNLCASLKTSHLHIKTLLHWNKGNLSAKYPLCASKWSLILHLITIKKNYLHMCYLLFAKFYLSSPGWTQDRIYCMFQFETLKVLVATMKFNINIIQLPIEERRKS